MSLPVATEYEKLWSDPALESRINEGIRRHRQSDAVVRVTDFAGAPLPGVKVFVDQHDSSFHFGANIFKLGDYPTEDLNRRYEEAFCALFNAATVPFYWRTLEPEQGRPRFGEHTVPIARRPPPDRVVEFCEERGLRMHGHTLVWNFLKWAVPDWLPRDIEKAAPLWEKRIAEIAARYGDRIKRWDVLNEAAAYYARTHLGLAMPNDYEALAFAWAEKYLPHDTRLDINETAAAWWFQKHPDYTEMIERLLSAGRRIGAVGLQFHLFSDADLARVLSGDLFTPDFVLAGLDHYARFHLPIHISEITLTAPDNSPAGLEAQAVVARNFYRLWFSHSATEGITWWNLPDGGAAPGEDGVFSGLLFDDMRPKPAYLALQDLIHREWRTYVEGVTDAEGCFRFRGFHGSHLIRTETGSQPMITLKPGKTAVISSAITLEPGKTAEQLIRL